MVRFAGLLGGSFGRDHMLASCCRSTLSVEISRAVSVEVDAADVREY